MTEQPHRVRLLCRRELLKLGLASGAALVLADVAGDHPVQAITAYYGVDSKTPKYTGYALDFYIGRGGLKEVSNDEYFSVGRAQDIYSRWGSYDRCHIYWRLYGPGVVPAGCTDYDWGKRQATAAGNAWYDATWARYVWGKTFFADIEDFTDGPHGWSSSYPSKNRDVLRGWLDGIYDFTRGYDPGFEPGIYTRPDLWTSWFGGAGSGYKTPRPATIWICNCGTIWYKNTGQSVPVKPCSDPSGAKSYAADKLSTVKETVFGGNKVVVYQFFIGGYATDCYGDFDASIQSGGVRFTPVADSRDYNYSCPPL